jgi:hypothetical protein
MSSSSSSSSSYSSSPAFSSENVAGDFKATITMTVYDLVRRTFFGVPGVYIGYHREQLTKEEKEEARQLVHSIKSKAKSNSILQLRLQLVHQTPSTLTVQEVLKKQKKILLFQQSETDSESLLAPNRIHYSSSITNPHVCIQPTECSVARFLLGEDYYSKYINNKNKKMSKDDLNNKLRHFIPYLNLIIDDSIIEVRSCDDYGDYNLGVFLKKNVPAKGFVFHQLAGIHSKLSTNQYDRLVKKELNISIVQAKIKRPNIHWIAAKKKNTQSITSTKKKKETKKRKKNVQYSTNVVLIGPLSFVNHRCLTHANVLPCQWGKGELSDSYVNHWKVCMSHDDKHSLTKNTELTTCYGKDFEKKFTCSLCSED